MKYVAYHLLHDTPNIIVDGKRNDHTRRTLSHWPGNETPPELKADLSAEIALSYLEYPEYHVDVPAVSNNHFDEDGLVGIWALLNPAAALERKQFLIEVASAGDFAACQDRDAARVCFVLSAWATKGRSPLNDAIFDQPYSEQTQVLYEELLQRFDKILDRFEYLEQFWIDEDKLLDQTESEIEEGKITLEEHPHADLAVVTLPLPRAPAAIREQQLALPWDKLLHRIGIHNRTERMRVLLRQGNRYQLYYRYETWVEYVSRSLNPRVDMQELARQLNELESAGSLWTGDGIDGLTPRLTLAGGGESKISPNEIVDRVASYLVSHAKVLNTFEKIEN